MLVKVSGNLNLDSFCEIVLIFLSNSTVILRQKIVIKLLLKLQINSSENVFSTLLVITNLLCLNTVFLQPFSFLFSVFLC